MQYFNSFNDVLYKFGNEASTVLTQDLSAYVSLIDDIKDDASAYEKGYIPEGMRPDQLSYQLYGTTIYHWTFYLLNDELRLQGWPLTTAELDETIKHEFGHTTLTTRVDITSKFKEGQTVSGSASGATGTIVHRVLDFGQIVLKDAVGTFRAGEAVTSVNSSFETESIVIVSGEKEYNAAHHYISNSLSDTIVDIDPAIGPGQLVTEVTNYEWYTEENNKLRNIKVIRPNIISTLVSSYKQALKK
jgi:hypothetical protein